MISNTSSQILIQVPNIMGTAGLAMTGRKWRVGYLMLAASNLMWVVWAYLTNNPGEYPWSAIWCAVAMWSWWKWRKP